MLSPCHVNFCYVCNVLSGCRVQSLPSKLVWLKVVQQTTRGSVLQCKNVQNLDLAYSSVLFCLVHPPNIPGLSPRFPFLGQWPRSAGNLMQVGNEQFINQIGNPRVWPIFFTAWCTKMSMNEDTRKSYLIAANNHEQRISRAQQLQTWIAAQSAHRGQEHLKTSRLKSTRFTARLMIVRYRAKKYFAHPSLLAIRLKTFTGTTHWPAWVSGLQLLLCLAGWESVSQDCNSLLIRYLPK